MSLSRFALCIDNTPLTKGHITVLAAEDRACDVFISVRSAVSYGWGRWIKMEKDDSGWGRQFPHSLTSSCPSPPPVHQLPSFLTLHACVCAPACAHRHTPLREEQHRDVVQISLIPSVPSKLSPTPFSFVALPLPLKGLTVKKADQCSKKELSS